LQLQVVFVFIVNAFNDETVSRKHVSCAPLKMCIYHSYLTDYQPCCLLVNIVVRLIHTRPANLRWDCVFSRFNKLYQFKINYEDRIV